METRMNDERAFNAAMDCVDLCEYYTKHPTNAKYIDGFLAAGFYDEDHIFADATLDCLKTNLNIAAATDGDNIFTARQVSAKQIRSMRFAVNPVEIKNYFPGDETLVLDYVFSVPNKSKPEARLIGSKRIPKGKLVMSKSVGNMMVGLAIGVQFLLENSPVIYLRPDYCTVGFRTPILTLSQAKELFSLRDIQPGYQRRKALKHWVKSHNRHKPFKSNDDKEIVEVRRYLRGAESFDWMGFHGEILHV